MSAISNYMLGSMESVFATRTLSMNGDSVFIVSEVFETQMLLLDGDNKGLQAKEHEYFQELHIDTADFLTDWLHALTAAISIFTGSATHDAGLIGRSFDWMAYHYNNSPRRTVRAMQELGLNDRAVQGIIYLLTGRLLEANETLNIVRFDYLLKND